ncbi:MAG: gamma-glutamylcyclotransferase [Candidatus Diapherotrites archaeon]|nr:gamma-glutamylcyclotransferase [Candidatus Diapherotrites archaeon]
MKSLNIKKAAAVAAGTALLVGAALAALPAKDFYWDVSGNTNVQIVVGSLDDAVLAGNLAARIGRKAYVETGGAVTPDATGTVKLKVSGASAVPTEGTYMDQDVTGTIVNEAIDSLTLGEAHGMHKGTFTFNNLEYDYKESVDVSNAVTLQYEEDKDHHGVYFEDTGSPAVKYRFDFIKNFPYSDNKLNQTLEIVFLGETYVVNKMTSNEMHLVKGEKVSLGIGQSTDVTVGDLTYTVTLDSASLDETGVVNVGYATVTVSGGDLTSPVSTQLDTGNNQDATQGGFYTYLQSVQKSYTPGQGGSATLRVGGELLKLIDNDKFPGSDIWKVDIVNAPPNTNYVDLYLNKNYGKNDMVTEIVGPKGYFTLKYAGTNADRNEIEVDKFTIHGTESSDRYIIDELTYSDTYENQYTVDMWDDSDYRGQTFLAENASAYVGYADNFTNHTINQIGYFPLRSGDYFIANEQPIKIDTIYYRSAPNQAKSYVKLNDIKYTLSNYGNITAANAKGDNEMAAVNAVGPFFLGYDNTTAGAQLIWEEIAVSTNQGTQNVNISLTSGDYMDYGSEDVIYVMSGADQNITSDYYDLWWPGPMWNWTNYTNITTGGHEYVYENNTLVAAIYRAPGSAVHGFVYDVTASGDYEGIREVFSDYIRQSVDKSGEDRFLYEELAYANLEATDSSTVEVEVFKENAKLRATLTPGVSETTGVSESAFTVDTTKTFPYDVTSDVTVTELTCDVESVATGVTFGTVSSNLVVSDSTSPTGNAIVIGGHYVNKLAVGKTEGTLTGAGTTMTELDGSTLYVAGYTASDTASAVNSLISAIEAL